MGKRGQPKPNRIKRALTWLLGIGAGLAFIAWSIALVHELTHRGVPVLMYHDIVPSGAAESRYALSEGRLEVHLNTLTNQGYTTITDLDLLAARDGTGSLPDKPIMLTFDDGSPDHYTRVLPLLKKAGAKAVFFIITGRIGQPGSLTAAEIRAMHAAGMSIQSHAQSAGPLTTRLPADALAEMTQSKAALELLLDTPVTTLALPGGAYDDAVLGLAADAGYRLVVSSDVGTNPTTDPFPVVRRLEIRGGLSRKAFQKVTAPTRIAAQAVIQKAKRIVKDITARRAPQPAD